MTGKSLISIIAAMIVAFPIGYYVGGLDRSSDTDVAVEAPMPMPADADMDRGPDPVAVTSDQVPRVTVVDAFVGMMGAYTVRIEIDNFTFTPDKLDQAPVQNEGHGHVYVNNQQAGRVYGEWIYIPGHYFEPGENQIKVSLHANSHGAWTFADAPIEATRFVTY